MSTLRQKIRDTALLPNEDKIAILAALDTYRTEDTNALERIIDEFDEKHRAAISEYKTSIHHTLNTIVSKARPEEKQRFYNAATAIRLGIDILIQ